MKNTPLVLSIFALVVAIAVGIVSLDDKDSAKAPAAGEEGTTVVAEKGAIVYFTLDRIFTEYDMANELSSAVESKIQSLSQEVERRGTKLQNDINTFTEKVNKGVLTRSVAEQQSQQLQKRQDEFNTYAAQKQQEAAEEQQVMINQILDALKSFLDEYNQDKEYSMIIANQAGDIVSSPIVIGDETLDITDDILAGLNEAYVKSKAKGQ